MKKTDDYLFDKEKIENEMESGFAGSKNFSAVKNATKKTPFNSRKAVKRNTAIAWMASAAAVLLVISLVLPRLNFGSQSPVASSPDTSTDTRTEDLLLNDPDGTGEESTVSALDTEIWTEIPLETEMGTVHPLYDPLDEQKPPFDLYCASVYAGYLDIFSRASAMRYGYKVEDVKKELAVMWTAGDVVTLDTNLMHVRYNVVLNVAESMDGTDISAVLEVYDMSGASIGSMCSSTELTFQEATQGSGLIFEKTHGECECEHEAVGCVLYLSTGEVTQTYIWIDIYRYSPYDTVGTDTYYDTTDPSKDTVGPSSPGVSEISAIYSDGEYGEIKSFEYGQDNKDESVFYEIYNGWPEFVNPVSDKIYIKASENIREVSLYTYDLNSFGKITDEGFVTGYACDGESDTVTLYGLSRIPDEMSRGYKVIIRTDSGKDTYYWVESEIERTPAVTSSANVFAEGFSAKIVPTLNGNTVGCDPKIYMYTPNGEEFYEDGIINGKDGFSDTLTVYVETSDLSNSNGLYSLEIYGYYPMLDINKPYTVSDGVSFAIENGRAEFTVDLSALPEINIDGRGMTLKINVGEYTKIYKWSESV